MARPKSTQPTDGEIEILNVLWNAGPSELGPICAALRRARPLATTTVATMLGVMLGKGLVRRSRGERGYLWSAKVDREATKSKLTERLIDRVFDGSAQLLVAHLVRSNKLTEKERRQVLELLARGTARSSATSSATPPQPPRSNS